jgi:transaldolase
MSELFLDSANLADIQSCVDHGIISGVTVNQSLLAKEPKRPFEDHLKDIIAIISPKKLHLSVPVPSAPAAEMIEAGKKLRGDLRYDNLSLKVPVTLDNMPVIRDLSAKGGTFVATTNSVNGTCVFSAQQAMIAAQAGAGVVSVFVGRINDIGTNQAGFDVLHMITGLKLGVKIIAGSIRDDAAVLQASAAGADIITTSRAVLELLTMEEHSQATLEKFNTDWTEWTK